MVSHGTDEAAIRTDPPGALHTEAQTSVSPFGPVRKNQPKPTPKIPGQRQPADTLPPRPAPPASVFTPDPKQVATWRDHAEQFLSGQQPEDRIGQPAAYDAFGAA